MKGVGVVVYPIEVAHGSVKDMEIFERVTPEILGRGRMDFTRRYSIFDLKKMPDEIYGREAQCILSAFNFEMAENNGIKTHYLGVDLDDKPISLDEAYDKGVVPTKMWVWLSRVIEPKVKVVDDKLIFDYSFFEENRGKLNNYVIPLEIIPRDELPEGNSITRGLQRAQKEGNVEYVKEMLEAFGLDEVPTGHVVLPELRITYTSKYEPLGDRPLDHDKKPEKALKISGLTEEQFEEVNEVNRKVSNLTKNHAKAHGIRESDKKTETLWYYNPRLSFYGPVLGDELGTLDGNRWFYDEQHVSKEFLRQLYEKYQPELRPAIAEAQRKAEEEAIKTGVLRDWRDYLTVQPIPLDQIDPSGELKKLIGEMHMSVTNLWTDREWYDVRPLGTVLKELAQLREDIMQRHGR